jgi:hypothetical protein
VNVHGALVAFLAIVAISLTMAIAVALIGATLAVVRRRP